MLIFQYIDIVLMSFFVAMVFATLSLFLSHVIIVTDMFLRRVLTVINLPIIPIYFSILPISSFSLVWKMKRETCESENGASLK